MFLLRPFKDNIKGHKPPTLPRTGPRRKAIVVYRGRWYPAPTDPSQGWDGDVMSACLWALSQGWVGAEIRCVGDKYPCARIDHPYSMAEMIRQNDRVPIGCPPGLALDEAQLLIA